MQIARTAAIFNIDELVIIDDTPQRKDGTVSAGAAFLARVAQYLETPQYLRKALIPMHPDLRLAGEASWWSWAQALRSAAVPAVMALNLLGRGCVGPGVAAGWWQHHCWCSFLCVPAVHHTRHTTVPRNPQRLSPPHL